MLADARRARGATVGADEGYEHPTFVPTLVEYREGLSGGDIQHLLAPPHPPRRRMHELEHVTRDDGAETVRCLFRAP